MLKNLFYIIDLINQLKMLRLINQFSLTTTKI